MKKVWVDLGLVLLITAGIFLFLKYPFSLKSGSPPQEEIEPEWLPSAPVAKSGGDLALFSAWDTETGSRQIYLFKGDLHTFEPEEGILLTRTGGDKTDPAWDGEEVSYFADDLTQREPVQVRHTAHLQFDRAGTPQLSDDQLAPDSENSLSPVPNLDQTTVSLDQNESALVLHSCDKVQLLPLPSGVLKKPILWGGTARSGKYLEAIFEIKEDDKHQFVYLKKGIADCATMSGREQTVDHAITAEKAEWDMESQLTCSGDNRNASLLLPTEEEPTPSLLYYQSDAANEKVAVSYLDLKKWIGKPCECGEDSECDDGNPCTTDSCADSACVYTKNDPHCCNTNEECGGKFCVNNLCQEEPAAETPPDEQKEAPIIVGVTNPLDQKKDTVTRDKPTDPCAEILCPPTGDPCQKNVCEPLTGKCALIATGNGTACDDGNSCTEPDVCFNGACKAGTSTCQCQSDADCAKQEDGNFCNGTLYCDTSLFKPLCKINPATVKTCPSGGDTVCQKNACNPATGKCFMQPEPEGTSCDDGDKCTKPDVCKGGECTSGAWNESLCQCKDDAGCTKFEDGNVCNGTLFCNLATSQCEWNPATVKTCPSVNDTECMENQCNPKTGICMMTNIKEGIECEDYNDCTPRAECKQGKCIGLENVCECQNDADCESKNKENLCQKYYCDIKNGQCIINPASVKVCPSVEDTECLKNLCNPQTGTCEKTPTKEGWSCDADGTYCTKEDSCQGGKCFPGPIDKQICPCQKDTDCPDDGNLCNGIPYCHPYMAKNYNEVPTFECKNNPATVITCPTVNNTECRITYCHPKAGKCLTADLDGNICDDGNPCTKGDICAAGECKSGLNVCECQIDADCVKLEDKDLCNGTLYCDKSAHKCIINPATVVTWCTEKTSCNPASGKCETATLP